MNAIANLLQRAKDEVELTSGTRVVRDSPEPLRGRVAFVDDGWVYWAAEDGHVHASKLDAIRRDDLAGGSR